MHDARLQARFLATMLLLASAVATGCGGDGGGDGGDALPAGHAVSGSVHGLTASGLVLGLGSEALPLPAGATSFEFARRLPTGAAYAVTIGSLPEGLRCTVAGANGAVPAAIGPSIHCAPLTQAVAGRIHGLGAATGLVLANGDQRIAVAAGATEFAFAAQPAGSRYEVLVAAQPAAGFACHVVHGAGFIGSTPPQVDVQCLDVRTFRIGGTITGLPPGPEGVSLHNGTEFLPVPGGAVAFRFQRSLPVGVTYSVSVVQPQFSSLGCEVARGSGVVQADVDDVAITCAPYVPTLGGSISGLGDAAGLVLANGADRLAVAPGATSFTMPVALPQGSPFQLTVASQPAGRTCSVSGPAEGTMPFVHVRNLQVVCAPGGSAVGGPVVGLAEDGLVLVNAGVRLPVPAGAASYAFSPVAPGAAYAVTVERQPPTQLCGVVANRGVAPATPLADAAVSCLAAGRVESLPGDHALREPQGLARAADGTLYYTARHEVLQRSPAGRVTTLGGSSSSDLADGNADTVRFNGPRGIAVAPDGSLYVADAFNGRVRRRAPDGQWSTLPWAPEPFYRPEQVFVDPAAGLLYVLTVSRIDRLRLADFSNLGTLTMEAGLGSRAATLDTARGLLYYIAGAPGFVQLFRLDLARWGPGAHTVRSRDVATIASLRHWREPVPDSFPSMAVDPHGNLYVSDEVDAQLLKFQAPVEPGAVVFFAAGTGSDVLADGLANQAGVRPYFIAAEETGAIVFIDRLGQFRRYLPPGR